MSDAWQEWHTAKVSGQFSRVDLDLESNEPELEPQKPASKEDKVKRDWLTLTLMSIVIVLCVVLIFILFKANYVVLTSQTTAQNHPKYAEIVKEFFKNPMVPGQKRRLKFSIRSCPGNTDTVKSPQLTKL